MKVTMYLTLLISLTFLASCGDKAKFEDHQSTGDAKQWKQEKTFSFSPKIEDINQKYQIILAFRHVMGFQLRTVPVEIKTIDPDGIQTTTPFTITVFNDKNECLSECAGDYCDLESVIEDNYSFSKKGNYTFEVKHTSSISAIPNVLELGLIVKPVKK